jgi:hypothetical protein
MKVREMQEKEQYFTNCIQEKEMEIQNLTLQVEIASKSSMEEVNETRQKIEESLRELEAHKTKRLAARNEMISLAKALEKAELEGKEMKSSIQYNLSPLISEQVRITAKLIHHFTNPIVASIDQHRRDHPHECRNGRLPLDLEEGKHCAIAHDGIQSSFDICDVTFEWIGQYQSTQHWQHS